MPRRYKKRITNGVVRRLHSDGVDIAVRFESLEHGIIGCNVTFSDQSGKEITTYSMAIDSEDGLMEAIYEGLRSYLNKDDEGAPTI